MSKIDKLSILGVRSFDNTRSEAIQFQSPLTLIVGPNGSGKTTIIESLKYATTGDLPPNTKGGAFIHDPKLCGEKEVLAQVRLSFRSTKGARIVCTRNLQLTVKKNTRSMKTLEGSLVMYRDGERQVLSTRVLEMDVRYEVIETYEEGPANRYSTKKGAMPLYLGTSKAILDSVIFCHQEESLWPLAEPAKLKQRFDEIFEALKYTKAIDNLKVIQKNKRDALIGYRKDEDHAKITKGRAEQNATRSTELFEKVEEQRVKADKLKERIQAAAQKSEDAWNKAETAGMIVGDLRGKRIEAESKKESVESLKENLNEMTDSDEELQRMLEQYDERVKDYQKDLDQQKTHYAELNDEIKEARNKVTSKERECGSYEAQKEHYEQQVKAREKLVKETARSHNVRGFDMDLGDDQIDDFMERITKMARDQNAAFERARRETQEELQRAQKVLNQINEQKTVLNQRRESAKQAITTNDKKINNLQSNLNKIDVDEGSKATLESNLREIKSKLENAKSESSRSNWDSSIETVDAELRQLDNRKEKLDEELVEGTRQAGDSARLDFVHKELKDRQGGLETMKGAHGDRISSIVGSGWTPSSLESDFQRALDQSGSHVVDAEKQRDGINQEMGQVEFKLNTCKTDLKNKRRDLKSAEDLIRGALDIEPANYPEELKKIEDSRDIVKTDAEAFSKVLEYFDSCIKTAKEHNGCRTCNRQFHNSQELEKMLKAVEKEKKKFQADDNAEQEMVEVEKDLQEAKALGPRYELWGRLKKELPILETDERRLSDKRAELIRQLEEQDEVVSSRQAAKLDIEGMSKNVQNIAKYNNEILSFENQIKELTANQKAAGRSRGLEIIREDIKKVNEEYRAAKSRLTKATNDRDHSKTLVNKLELEKRDAESKLSTADYQIKERKSLEAQIEEYKGLNSEQRESIKTIDQEKQSLEPQLSQAQAKYDDISRRGVDKERELQTGLSKLNSSLSDLEKADQEVKAYVEKGGPQQLARGKRDVENLKAEVTRLEQDQARIVREVKSLEDQFRNHSETKRGIADNQRYRRDLRQLQKVRAEIEELEAHNAEEDKAYYEHEGSKWQMERNKLSAEEASIMGSMRTMDDQLQQLRDDWEVHYKDAAKEYKKAHIMVETTKACVEDLGRYRDALDSAIMKFHSLKMEEINRIIQELWRNTYQGTDVDSIMIRSESEDNKNGRSKNYRVVMVKQDVEMDMRGRCSAGQKVLASIIIRLALAECFGVNCGLITLDEPTTNLDRDNIQALAKSLYEIIKMRMKQKNFQLIVITHDEEFLRHMQCSDFTENYWRVSRDPKQKSIIEKQNVSQVI